MDRVRGIAPGGDGFLQDGTHMKARTLTTGRA